MASTSTHVSNSNDLISPDLVIPSDPEVDEVTHAFQTRRNARGALALLLFFALIVGSILAVYYIGDANIVP